MNMTPTRSLGKKVGRTVLVALSAVLACVLVIVGVLRIMSPGKPAPILDGSGHKLAGSISEKVFVTINGVKQGMFIRGRSTANPVLLFVHGGPGMPEYFMSEAYPTGLEDYFTVCWWEQRGAGLSDDPAHRDASLTAEQLVSDTVAVTNYLRERFGQSKIYLMGHSWGSFLGIQAAARAPELYHAYLGMGQVSRQAESEKIAYAYMLEQYTAVGNAKMLRKLEQYPLLESDATLRSYFTSMLRDDAMHKLGIGTTKEMESVVTGIFIPVMKSRAYTLGEKINLWRAKAFLRGSTELIDEMFAADMSVMVPRLEIPAYFLCGRYDYTSSYALAAEYFAKLEAPVKGFYTFEQSAHSPLFEEPEKMLRILREDVLAGKTGLADAPSGR